MSSVAAGPVRLRARLDAPLSRWLWLVKWLLALPHVVVLALLWAAFAVLSVVAFVAILVTGRYPHAIFTSTSVCCGGTWRVAYYTYGALGTDRYPPFTLGEAPDYPATLDVAYPQHLSRGLVLVKWWLLAVPHYLVLAFFLGGGSYVAYQATDPSAATGSWSYDGGLIGLLALIAGVALLFTGRYPRGVFDLLLGLHRWVLRVAAYAALMTDAYPPFRLDLGGSDPADLPLTDDGGADAAVRPAGGLAGTAEHLALGGRVVGRPRDRSRPRLSPHGDGPGSRDLGRRSHGGRPRWSRCRRFRHDRPDERLDARLRRGGGPGAAADEPGAPALGATLGDVRVSAVGTDTAALFVGIGPAADVEAYLAGVERSRLTGGSTAAQVLPGGAPATPPAQQGFWVATAAGPGPQQLTWTASEGQWAVVVMNADGSRAVTAELTAGVTAPVLPGLWTGLLAGAAAALLAGALLVALAIPRGSAERVSTGRVTEGPASSRVPSVSAHDPPTLCEYNDTLRCSFLHGARARLRPVL